MNKQFIIQCINNVVEEIRYHEYQIESLDRAIGDGDHYINLKRGCEAIQAIIPTFEKLSTPQIFYSIGVKLLSTIGGASGPLFASFFIEFSKNIASSKNELTNVFLGFEAGVEAIKKRGKSGSGEKTMLDVLIPVLNIIKKKIGNSNLDEIIHAINEAANDGVEATKTMLPTKGRAVGLGDRAIGHIDPGAKSCQLIIATIGKKILEEKK